MCLSKFYLIIKFWAGHSRTIIGVEELKDGSCRLLIFDPSCSRKQMQQFVGDVNSINVNLMRTLRRTLHSMRAKQYQLVAVVGVLTDKEYEVLFLSTLSDCNCSVRYCQNGVLSFIVHIFNCLCLVACNFGA